MSWFLLPLVTVVVLVGPLVPAVPAWLWFRHWDHQDEVRDFSDMHDRLVMWAGGAMLVTPYLLLALVGITVWDPTLVGCPPFTC